MVFWVHVQAAVCRLMTPWSLVELSCSPPPVGFLRLWCNRGISAVWFCFPGLHSWCSFPSLFLLSVDFPQRSSGAVLALTGDLLVLKQLLLLLRCHCLIAWSSQGAHGKLRSEEAGWGNLMSQSLCASIKTLRGGKFSEAAFSDFGLTQQSNYTAGMQHSPFKWTFSHIHGWDPWIKYGLCVCVCVMPPVHALELCFILKGFPRSRAPWWDGEWNLQLMAREPPFSQNTGFEV